MEIACGFVYVPPVTSQKDGQRSSPNNIKRSALLPPFSKVRPCFPPPLPPAANGAKLKTTQSLSSNQKFIERLENNSEVKRGVKPSPTYVNIACWNAGADHKAEADASAQIAPPQKPKIALLPPHMRPARSSSLPYSQPLTSPGVNSLTVTYDLPKEETPDINPWDPDHPYSIPECSSGEISLAQAAANGPGKPETKAPPLPPRPSFMKSMPEYLVLLPTSPASSSSAQIFPASPPPDTAPAESADDGHLPGNPNVILVSLGKLLSEENVCTIEGYPPSCSQCGSVLDTYYDNMVDSCYFCQSSDPTALSAEPQCPQNGCQDSLFLVSPNDKPLSPSDALLIFCIDISGSMSITSQVLVEEQVIYRTRLQFVQDAVLLCIQRLYQQQPDIRVGLITFSNQVTIHGCGEATSRFLCNSELIDTQYLKEAAWSFPSPPPLTRTRDCLKKELLGLLESGATALGPAALLAIAMASRHPGSKVIICTDGKANTELGNLEVEDNNACTLLSSTIFYQDLGEYAARQGVTVSVLSLEGTDCRLDELGRLADRTGGMVVIARPQNMHTKFKEMIENKVIATHCSVTLLLPKTLRVKGEKEADHKGTREVGNVAPHSEITLQFGPKEDDQEAAPASGSCVSIQLQLRYRLRDGRKMLRVLTADRQVTNDSSSVLSTLSLAIIQLNSSQASAALAVRGRSTDARRESQMQRKLIERALEHNRSAEAEQIYYNWVKTMEPIHSKINNYMRRGSVISDTQPLTDRGAALLYSMKHSNRKSISLRNKQC